MPQHRHALRLERQADVGVTFDSRCPMVAGEQSQVVAGKTIGLDVTLHRLVELPVHRQHRWMPWVGESGHTIESGKNGNHEAMPLDRELPKCAGYRTVKQRKAAGEVCHGAEENAFPSQALVVKREPFAERSTNPNRVRFQIEQAGDAAGYISVDFGAL